MMSPNNGKGYGLVNNCLSRVIQIDAGRPLTCLAFMDDGCNIAVGSHGRILFYDLRNTHQPKMNVDVANREIHYLTFSSAKVCIFMH